MRRRSSMRRSTSRLRRAGLSVRGARAGTTKSSSSREEEITNLLALNASVVAGERHPSEKVAYCQKATTVSFLRQRKLRSRSRSEEHTPELQSLMRITYPVFCLKKN